MSLSRKKLRLQSQKDLLLVLPSLLTRMYDFQVDYLILWALVFSYINERQ